MNIIKCMIKRYVPEEIIYFVKKRVLKKDYGIKIYNKSDVDIYDEDCLFTFGKNLHFLYEEKFNNAYKNAVEKNLYVSPAIRWRLHVLCWAGAVASKLEGDFVECGVNKGFSSKIIIDYLNFENLNKDYYLMDTFDGLSEELLTNEEKTSGRKDVRYEPCINIVKKVFGKYKNVKIIQGRIPDTLSQVNSEKIAFLHIDMNCVVPEIEAMKYFYDKLVTGAIVVFDDYGWATYVEQQRAHDIFAESKGLKILTLPTGQGLMIKP